MTGTVHTAGEAPAGLRLADADQHYYEATDALTRHLEPEHRATIQWAIVGKRSRLLVGDRVLRLVANPTFDPVALPGRLADYFRGVNPDGATPAELIGALEPIRREYHDRGARVAVLDAQGVETTLMLPTLALGLEELLCRDDPAALHAVLRAFNRWVDDDWGFARDRRIVAAPVLALVDPDEAEAELVRVRDAGARLICMRPGPIVGPRGGRSPGDPAFDRFWATAADAGIVVAYHSADSGYTRYTRDWGEGVGTPFQGYADSPFSEILSIHVERPIFDTVAAMLAHGVFDRHPALRVATVELGSRWAADLIRHLRTVYGKVPRAFRRDPVESFREHVWVTPFQEDHLYELVALLGADRVMFGSDWPHPEGVAEPIELLAEAADLTADQQQRVMGDNLRELLRL